MNAKERKRIIAYGFAWFFLISAALAALCGKVTSVLDRGLLGHCLAWLFLLLTFYVWLLLSPFGGGPLLRFRLRRHMTMEQIRSLRAGHLPKNVRCEATLRPYEQCFYAAGARWITVDDKSEFSEPIYGKLLITNHRIIFLNKWYGKEIPLSNIRTCQAKWREVDIQATYNWNYIVRYPKEVASMIDRLRHDSEIIEDIIIDDMLAEP